LLRNEDLTCILQVTFGTVAKWNERADRETNGETVMGMHFLRMAGVLGIGAMALSGWGSAVPGRAVAGEIATAEIAEAAGSHAERSPGDRGRPGSQRLKPDFATGSNVGAEAPTPDQDAVQSVRGGFSSGTAKVNGTTLHYVISPGFVSTNPETRFSSGFQSTNPETRKPVVILLHGFPEDWYEFRKVMPRLAKKFTAVAVDLRGVGGSEATAGGYDAANLAEDIHQLAEQLHLEHVYVVGHDIGGMVAYAFARRYPETARGVMILDVAIPGLEPWEEIQKDKWLWHIRFHQTDLPEKLVAGRQVDYFRYFLRAENFSDADVAHYAEAYREPDHLRTAFEFYRAFPEDAKFNAGQTNRIELPIVFGAGEYDAFTRYLPTIVEAMKAHGCVNLKTEVVKGSVHYVFEEKPEAMAELIERYAGM
jgi:pimeloyl-ACP methyl ester carboxylesterase